MIFETHAHYDDEAFDQDRDKLLSSFHDNNICCVIDVASSLESHGRILEITEKYPFVYGTVGVHPDEINNLSEEAFGELRKLCSLPKTVAVGEVGLDYHWNKDNKELQIYWFERFIDLAKKESLPLILHSRDAACDMLSVIKNNNVGEIGAVMHCYSYSAQIAEELLDMGFYFGIGGVLTFKNARKLVETVRYLPMSSMLLETDSPYLSPVPLRGRRNCSLNLSLVAEKIAEIKGISSKEVIRHTNENARRLFRKTSI